MIPSSTRVRFVAGDPQYLHGCTATVLHKQPGEPRYLVHVDADPKARKYAGGTWCVHELSIEQVDREWADEKGKNAAERWLRAIAPRIEEEARRWADENPELDRDTYFEMHHPHLLWRFYFHLSELLADQAKGWEQLYHQAKEEHDARDS